MTTLAYRRLEMKRRFVLVVLAVSLVAGFLMGQAAPQQISFAQEETDVRFYIMPIMVVVDFGE